MRVPLVTLGTSLFVAVMHFVPGFADGMGFDRAAAMGGDWWRTLTAHMAHFTPEHLWWNVGTFCVLGVLVERRGRMALTWTLVLGTVAVSAAILFGTALPAYRGMSGLAAALFMALAVQEGEALHREGRTSELTALGVLVVGLVGKILFETFTGHALFADDPAYAPVPLAHLVGALAGLVGGLAAFGRPTWTEARARPQSCL